MTGVGAIKWVFDNLINLIFSMKVIQIVPSIRLESSGPSYSVPGLCAGLLKNGCDVSLHFLGNKPNRDFEYPVHTYRSVNFPHPRLGRSPDMLKGLVEACKTADVIHNNSLWMMPNIYSAWAKKGTRCKLVNQPRGTLSRWALGNSKWKKRLIGWFGQYAAMRATDMWVATAEDEYEDIRRFGYNQPVAILPNGIDLPKVDSGANVQKDSERRRMFFLSRIHPKKNVEMLIRSWAKLENRFADWDLSIVGPDKNNTYADDMKALAKTLGCRRVTFEGELKGERKYRFMAESECEVLPTHSENFGMVVAEALACRTPVICSQGAPWKGLETEKCGWWIPTEEAAFDKTMSDVMSMSRAELSAMGVRGRDWMKRDFTWAGIGRKMKAAYEWLLGKVDRPEWVKVM